MKQTRKTSHQREKNAPSSVRFVFRGAEYWVVGRDLSEPETATGFTPAEAQVLALLRAGLTYDQIAASRGRSRHTVAKQVTRVLRKLKVASQRELKLLP